MKRTTFFVDSAIAAASFAQLATARQLDAQVLTTIDAAGTANDTSGLIFYALDMGFYERAGLRVNLTSVSNSGVISSAIASGAIQIGSFAISIGALAREHGLPLQLIAPAGLYLSTTPTSGIIVNKDSPIRRAADLNGKTIATRDLSNMSYFGARQWIDKNGGDSKTVRWIEVPDASDVAALAAGRVDAASVSEPALDDAVTGGTARSLASPFDAIANRFLISGYFTTEDYAKSHPGIVRQFAVAMANTAAWANKNHPRTAQILEKYIKTPVLPGSARVTYAERLAQSDVQPVLDMLYTYGFLKNPMNAKAMFSPLVSSR
jgi:NitT/TauT family transport system substrate-binding protein